MVLDLIKLAEDHNITLDYMVGFNYPEPLPNSNKLTYQIGTLKFPSTRFKKAYPYLKNLSPLEFYLQTFTIASPGETQTLSLSPDGKTFMYLSKKKKHYLEEVIHRKMELYSFLSHYKVGREHSHFPIGLLCLLPNVNLLDLEKARVLSDIRGIVDYRNKLPPLSELKEIVKLIYQEATSEFKGPKPNANLSEKIDNVFENIFAAVGMALMPVVTKIEPDLIYSGMVNSNPVPNSKDIVDRLYQQAQGILQNINRNNLESELLAYCK